MATHSSILTGKIPCTEEPGGLHSMGSQRVGYNWATEHTWIFSVLQNISLWLIYFIHSSLYLLIPYLYHASPTGNQEFVLFHFLLGFFASSFFSFWWAWLEVCWFYLLKNISSHFYWYFLFFKTLFYLFFLFIISYLLLTLFLFVLCSSSFLGDRFGCLLENFLVSGGRPYHYELPS